MVVLVIVTQEHQLVGLVQEMYMKYVLIMTGDIQKLMVKVGINHTNNQWVVQLVYQEQEVNLRNFCHSLNLRNIQYQDLNQHHHH